MTSCEAHVRQSYHCALGALETAPRARRHDVRAYVLHACPAAASRITSRSRTSTRQHPRGKPCPRLSATLSTSSLSHACLPIGVAHVARSPPVHPDCLAQSRVALFLRHHRSLGTTRPGQCTEGLPLPGTRHYYSICARAFSMSWSRTRVSAHSVSIQFSSLRLRPSSRSSARSRTSDASTAQMILTGALHPTEPRLDGLVARRTM
ncbi:uncharacterized protein C8Q71DRAFT_362245 [Rhodofomes roseus]|uniref:Uncharacterized protein n=1 Tax=Rhodofomes roseus TaxID=34475 RepID=A0ABQ8K2H0_9APHY|nr:uncharacterized protein C8Q71DRAFT_362245 [Rhodofomes roseus]KAH9830665.1 hypothetical protein C8Q71DRAFT_362245 [Rhodofomes roseus]